MSPLFRNILENVKLVDLLEPDAYTASTNVSAIIDRRGYDQLIVCVYMGAGVGTKVNDITVYDDISVGMGTEALFATLSTLTSQGHDDALHHAVVDLEGANRYIRIKAINDDTLDFAVFGVLGRTNALLLPVTQEETAQTVIYA